METAAPLNGSPASGILAGTALEPHFYIDSATLDAAQESISART